MIEAPTTRTDGLKLLRSLARKPGYERGTISRSLSGGGVASRGSWKQTFALPELYEVIRDDLVPQPTETTLDPWTGIESYLPVFLAEAARQNRLSDLAEIVSRASSARPAWAGGKAILALIDIHRGNDDQARARLLPLIESDQSPMPAHARRVIVSVMDGARALHDLALRIADGVSDTSLTNWMTAYRGSLAQIHVDLYRSSGQFAKRASWR